MSDLKEVNTVRETAAYLGKSVLTIRNWIAAGKRGQAMMQMTPITMRVIQPLTEPDRDALCAQAIRERIVNPYRSPFERRSDTYRRPLTDRECRLLLSAIFALGCIAVGLIVYFAQKAGLPW